MATSSDKQWLVAYGGLGEGFRFVGMFDNPGDAIAWCEENLHADPWWVVPVSTDEQFQEENA